MGRLGIRLIPTYDVVGKVTIKVIYSHDKTSHLVPTAESADPSSIFKIDHSCIMMSSKGTFEVRECDIVSSKMCPC